jgi:TPR repeat protein
MRLGRCISDIKDVAQDYTAALTWFLRGAQLDDADSLYKVGVRYALGQGVEQDEIEAYKWFDLAADAGIGEIRSRAVRARQAIGEGLMPLQVSKAKIGAREWLRVHGSASASLETLLRRNRPARGTALERHEADTMMIRLLVRKAEVQESPRTVL